MQLTFCVWVGMAARRKECPARLLFQLQQAQVQQRQQQLHQAQLQQLQQLLQQQESACAWTLTHMTAFIAAVMTAVMTAALTAVTNKPLLRSR